MASTSSIKHRDYASPTPKPAQPNGDEGGQGREKETVTGYSIESPSGPQTRVKTRTVDPNLSPEEKRSQILNDADHNLPTSIQDLKTSLNGIKHDLIESNMTNQDVKSTLESSASSNLSAQPIDPDQHPQEGLPGSLTQKTNETGTTNEGTAITAVIPDWYKVGWQAQIEHHLNHPDQNDGTDQNHQNHHLHILETFLDESYFGTWYHNAGIIFFTVAASHYITLLGGGWSLLIIILSISTTYYQLSIRRVRREIRGDLSRELAKQRLFQDHETVDWLNNFLNRFWLIYEPVLSATIVASVDQILVASTPTFLESIRMSTFTLGSKAPRVDFIRSHPETDNDVVVMDWKFDFTPNDVSDLTAKEALHKVNPKIVLTIKFGKGLIGAAKDIVVENITFCGTIRIRIKLMNNFPHLQLIDLSFLEKPEFDFVLKPIGFDLNMIPGLSGFIESQVHATLGPMMYDPNVFTLNLEQMLAGVPVDSAIGVLQVTLYHATGLKTAKIGGGTPDPYVTLSVGARVNLERTKIKRTTANPHWNSTYFVLINSLNEIMTMEVMDYNEVRKDTSIGTANFDLISLMTDPEQESVTVPVLHQSKPRGEIRIGLSYHPCLVPKKLENGEEEAVPETRSGVVRLILHQAKDLDYKRTGANSNVSPYGKIYLNGKMIFKTPTMKRTKNPVYETFFEFLVPDKSNSKIEVKMFDDRTGEDPLIGELVTELQDLLDGHSNIPKSDWFPLGQAKSGKIRMSVMWKGVIMAGAINGASVYTPPIGVLKFWFNKAEDLKNVEALTGGKSDPYVRVMKSGIILARTHIHNNNLDPEFDEIIYVSVHSVKDCFRLEVMDYQHMTKDRSLGIIELDVKSLIDVKKESGEKNEEKSYESTGKKHYQEYLKQEGKKSVVKGKLDYDVEFYPCSRINFKAFDKPASDLEKLKTQDESESNPSRTPIDGKFDEDRRSSESASHPLNRDSHEMVETIDPLFVNKTQTKVMKKRTSVKSDRESLEGFKELKEAEKKKNARMDQNQEIDQLKLLESQSGIVVFNIMGGKIARRNARLEFLFDDGYWPSYSTEPSKSTQAKWDETGESFIRELDWSRCTLKLNVAEKDTREEVYAEYSSGLRSFLEETLVGPHDFVLMDGEGGSKSVVTIQCRYIPVPITLEPRESINNMGFLTVMLDHGKDLKAADRNGYSDPYAQFILNGMKVFKSSVQKKTLNPKWMERFDVEVPSRVHADFVIQIYDWDRVGASDKLGQAKIDLKDLEPMEQITKVLKLTSGDQQHGQIQIRVTFRPNFITRSREATSTFTGLGRVATGLGGTVLSTGAGVGIGAAKGVGQVGGGVVKGVGGVGKMGFAGIRRIAGGGGRRESIMADDADSVAKAESPAGFNLGNGGGTPKMPDQFSTPDLKSSRIHSPTTTSPSSARLRRRAGNEPKVRLEIISANGVMNPDGRIFIQVKKNGKSIFETKTNRENTSRRVWEESVIVDVKNGEGEIELIGYEKRKLLGKDREIGEFKIDLMKFMNLENGREVELNEPMGEVGNIQVRISLIENPRREQTADSTSPMRESTIGGLISNELNQRHRNREQEDEANNGDPNQAGNHQAFYLEQDPNGMNYRGETENESHRHRKNSISGGKSQRSIPRFSLHRHR